MAPKRKASSIDTTLAPPKRATRSSARIAADNAVSPVAAPAKTKAQPAKAKKVAKAAKPAKKVAKAAKPAKKVAAKKAAPAKATAPAAKKAAISTARRLDDIYARRFGDNGSSTVVRDFDVMLNQVVITDNKNKFYRMQLLQMSDGSFDVFTRWGRVGEDGVHKLLGRTTDFTTAEYEFMKKFADKTKNKWTNRNQFVPKHGAYEIVELDATATTTGTTTVVKKTIGDDSVPSKLAPRTQKLIQMIFDKDMFKNELVRMNLDPQRMPLGTLSLSQIQKGVDILDQLRDAMQTGGRAAAALLSTYSSKFYQLIPHAFSRHTIPPVLRTPQDLEAKYEMLATLHDIVVAQDVEKALGESTATPTQHSLDLKYAELHSDLDLVTPTDPLFDVVQTYIANTKGSHYGNLDLLDIWAVRREPEDASFKSFASTPNHRLLWHGTNVAVVAAILKSGLRIMPSSGGRVGKGIYLANMLEKSRAYVRATPFEGQNIGCLFLVEAALGKMNEIHRDDSSLTKPPSGYDSVLAKGTVHPSPAMDETIELDGTPVQVNVGSPVQSGVSSSFHHDEYLVYKESQQRLRFIITFKM
ncbi:Aste57867_24121 [Aphanomyces stellatus]|uniref:Poly [ADP-ribose] polymerase n=1 Tax=Aphanomyces stellatus TaxID=120398 RepID=A0A485LPM0_9STRA|nr:hypothetical protein As57867_024047 [Aphanomyces stellatus]VFU00763.1 Aste57867_24121 [Aphanomyces stellatus]